MRAAKRDGKFVTHLATHRARVRETHVVRVRWGGAARDAWLRRDEPRVVLVAEALWFGEGEGALVDARGCCRRRRIITDDARARSWSRALATPQDGVIPPVRFRPQEEVRRRLSDVGVAGKDR